MVKRVEKSDTLLRDIFQDVFSNVSRVHCKGNNVESTFSAKANVKVYVLTFATFVTCFCGGANIRRSVHDTCHLENSPGNHHNSLLSC